MIVPAGNDLFPSPLKTKSMYQPTIDDMKLISAAPTEEVVVGGYEQEFDGGGGIFVWKTGASLPAEDYGTIFYSTVLSGGWYERVLTGDTINLKWYGVKSDYAGTGIGTDWSCEIQNAFDLGAALHKKVVADKGGFRVTKGLHIKGDVDFGGATLYFEGDDMPTLLSQKVEADILNLNIDGSGVGNCINGLYVNTNYVTTRISRYVMRIEHLKNIRATESCNGAVFIKEDTSGLVEFNNKYDISISCKDISATANGVIGDTPGSATGILFSMNAAGTDAWVIIRDLEIDGCGPVEDSAGINIYTADYRGNGKGQFLVENVTVRNCLKRGIKIQSPNTVVRNATVYCEQTNIGFDTYAADTQFISCDALNLKLSAFYTSYKDTLIRDCRITTGTASNDISLIVADTESERLRIDNVVIELNKEFLSDLGTVIRSEAASDVYVQNIVLKTAKKKGSFLSANSGNDVYIDQVTVDGLSAGIVIGNNTGRVFVSNSRFKTRNNCMLKIGENVATVYTHDCSYESRCSTVINLSGTGYSAVLHMNDCNVTGPTNGVLPAAGSSVRNSVVRNNATDRAGHGISIQNGTVDGCQVLHFDYGLIWTYSTVSVMTNNTVVDCNYPFDHSASTTYVEYQNIPV